MKWIVFQSIDSKVAPVNYSASIKIAYLLNQKVVSVGLDSGFYFFIESTTKLPLIKKIEHLLEINKDEPHTCKILLESKESIKLYNKIKSKSSKHIVLISKIKTTIELAYKEFQEDYIKALPVKIGDKIMDEDGRVGQLSRIVPYRLPSERFMCATLSLTLFFHMEKKDGTYDNREVYVHGFLIKL